MKANCWVGKKSVRVEQVPDPQLLNQGDAIVRPPCWKPTAPSRCVKPSWPVAAVGLCLSVVSMAALSTNFRWARSSIAH